MSESAEVIVIDSSDDEITLPSIVDQVNPSKVFKNEGDASLAEITYPVSSNKKNIANPDQTFKTKDNPPSEEMVPPGKYIKTEDKPQVLKQEAKLKRMKTEGSTWRFMEPSFKRIKTEHDHHNLGSRKPTTWDTMKKETPLSEVKGEMEGSTWRFMESSFKKDEDRT